jgi:streptogramin lyase
MAGSTGFIADDASGVPGPANYSPLSIQGHSLDAGAVTCNQGQWSSVAEAIRTNQQAKTIYNFQMLKRGIWSNPTGIGFTLQRTAQFNSGAAFMDFGVFEDFQGNQTLLFQVGNQVYSYNLNTSTETAYNAPLTSLSTSLANLPCMRPFVDNTGNAAPLTVYCNGAIQPAAITGTAAANVRNLNFAGTGGPTTTNPNGGQFGQTLPISTYTAGTYVGSYPITAAGVPTRCCLGPDGNVWYTDYANSKIGKITPAGIVTEYATPTGASGPIDICAGPDGNLWFVEHLFNNLGKCTTAGVMNEYNIGGSVAGPSGICAGPDGNLWVVGTTAGSGITAYNTSGVAQGALGGYTGTGICVGPDSRLWVTSPNAVGLVAVTVAFGGTTYTTGLPVATSFTNAYLTSGPDGRVWFQNPGANTIGAITTTGAITNYVIPTASSKPQYGITKGSDGNVWFSETQTNKVTRITPAGVFTEFVLPVGTSPTGICTGVDGNFWFCGNTNATMNVMVEASANARGICVGPDNNLWFCEYGSNKIGKYTISGNPTLTEYIIPTANSGPVEICSDGTNLWFTEYLGNKIGKITTAGVITEYPLGTASSYPVGICLGSDGNLWFTESGANNKVAKITTGGTITEYPITSGNAAAWGIASDGTNLWFCESATSKIAKCTTGGTVTEYALPQTGSAPLWITKGSDARMWFTENINNKIGAITSTGTITEYIIPTAQALPQHIVAASDGNLYFVESGTNQIGRITTTGTFVEWPITTNNAEPYGVVDGPDQSLWYTDNGASNIGNFLYGGSGSWPGTFQLTKKTYGKPKYCTYFNNRMAYFGFDTTTNAALDVLISNQGNAEQFITSAPIQATDAVSFTVPGLGLPTGCFAFRPNNQYNQEVLILGFQRGIAVIAGNANSTDATTMECTILTREYGLMSNRTFNQIQNDVYFLSTNGVRNYSSLIINANLLNEGLTYQMQDVIQQICNTNVSGTNINYNSQAFAVHYRPTLEVQFWYPSIYDGVSGSNFTNQNAIIMNYNTVPFGSSQLQPIFSTKGGMSAACGIYFNGNMYCGDYLGYLQVHYSGNTYNGVAIPGQIELALINNGNIQQSQEMRQAIVILEGQNEQFEVTTYFYTAGTDNSLTRAPSPQGQQPLTVPSSGNTIMGSWIMGVSSFPASHIKHAYFESQGMGPYLNYLITTNGITDSCDFVAVAFTLTVGGLRP